MASRRRAWSSLAALGLGVAAALVCLELGLAAFGGVYRRLRERRQDAVPGRDVILCLGDSFTMGVGAPAGLSYPDQLEALLNAGPGRKFRVVNAGQGAANTTIARRIFLEKADSLKPKIVTMMLGPANYWNLSGFHRQGRSASARFLLDAWRGIRVVRLAGLLRRQWMRTQDPGFQPEERFASDWDRGLIRCPPGEGRGGPLRRGLAEEVFDLLADRKAGSAQAAIDEALRSGPRDGRVHALEGFVRRSRSDEFNALTSFETAGRMAPEDVIVRLGLAQGAFRRASRSEAARIARQAASSAPGDAVALWVAGFTLEEAKDDAGAVALFQRSIRLDPCGVRSLLDLARVYERLGRLEEARGLLLEARRLRPSGTEPIILLSRIATRQGRPEEARRLLESSRPLDAQAKLDLRLEQGDFDEVLRICREAKASDLAAACLSAAESMLQTGADPRTVLRLAESLRRSQPGEAGVPFVMAKAQMLLGRGREADSLFASSAALRPADPRVMFDIAKAYLLAHRLEEAREWALRGRSLDPETPDFPLLMLQACKLRRGGPVPEAAAEAERWAKEARVRLGRGRHLRYWTELGDLPPEEVLKGPVDELDAGGGGDTVESWIRDDLAGIMRECRKRGIKVFLMNYPRPTRFPGYRELAASEGAFFVDVEGAFDRLRRDGSEAGYFVPDGHCSSAGNAVVARTLAEGIRSAGLLSEVP